MLVRRFLIIAVVGIILSFSLLVYLVADKETQLSEKAAEEKSALYGSLVTTAMKTAMAEGAPERVETILRDLNRTGPFTVSIFKADGSPAFGAKNMGLPPEMFGIQKPAHFHFNGMTFFQTPLFNERDCHRCHSGQARVLGFAVIAAPESTLLGHEREMESRMVLFGTLLIVAACIAVFLVAKKTLLDPLLLISEAAQAVKKGDLTHRIPLKGSDELAALASTFNEMTERIERSRAGLEKAVAEKTTELKVIAELSTEVFKGTLSLKSIVEQFLDTIVEKMGFGYAALCLVDKETGVLSREFNRGTSQRFCSSDISLASEHPFARAIREARPTVRRNSDVGAPDSHAVVAIIPLLSHQRKRCMGINLCTLEDCPGFYSEDERCWLVEGTLCRSPQAVAGKEKIFGCLHCAAFPVIGVFVAGKNGDLSKSTLHSLEILSSEMTSAIENQRFIEGKREDIRNLVRLHDISIESLQNLQGSLPRSIVTAVPVFSDIEAAILWSKGEDGRLYFEDACGIEPHDIPKTLPAEAAFAGRILTETDFTETLEIDGIGHLATVAKSHKFLYAASVPLKSTDTVFGCLTLFKGRDFLMSESEKVAIVLFASRAASALNTAKLYAEIGKREHSYRTLAENLPGIVYRIFLRENNRMQFFNNMVLQMTGFSPEKLSSGGVCALGPLIVPEDFQETTGSVSRALENDMPFEVEYRVRDKRGDIRHFLDRGRPVKGDDGSQHFVDGVIFDITAIKKAEKDMEKLLEGLRTEKEFSEAIFQCALTGILVLDKEGRILKINRSGAEALHLDPSGITGRKITDFYAEATAFLSLGPEITKELSLRLPDDTDLPIGFNNSPLFVPSEGKESIIVLLRDLTELKKLREELRKKANFETIGKVVSGVAHEVRNPLFGISSIGQILEREIDTPQHRALIQAMLKETKRMRLLIDELLLYSRPSRLDIKKLEVGPLMEGLKLHAARKRADIDFSVDMPMELTISADKDKIFQVFINVINNALDAAHGSIKMTASSSNGAIRFRIADDGPGIPPEDMGKIFEPFFTTKKGGTGLGLPICRKIVEDHGGDIEVLSENGAGTEIILTLKA